MERQALLRQVADAVLRLPVAGVLRVAVDGVDGAGKTHFADELAHTLQPSGRPLIRASVDGFHNPRAVRYRRGRSSPEGFFRDSYDYAKLKEVLLDPLSPGGSRRFRRAAFDHANDAPVEAPLEEALSGSILIFDGIFLHRPELRGYWDYSVFLEVGFEVSIPRGAQRGPGYGSPDPHAESNRRYVEGQKLYLSECNPKAHASVVINNENLADPYFVAGG